MTRSTQLGPRITSLPVALVVGIAVFSTVACGSSDQTPANAVDSIYHGDSIYLGLASRERAEAIAVKDGRIVRVGSLAEMGSVVGPDTNVVDLDPYSYWLAPEPLVPGGSPILVAGGGISESELLRAGEKLEAAAGSPSAFELLRGGVADFWILDRDPFASGTAAGNAIRLLAVIRTGEVVYESDALSID